MKLRNKKSGEIVEFKTPACMVDEKYSYQYNSLAELNDEWEDVSEEPKEYWTIDCFSTDGNIVSQFTGGSDIVIENRKSIGDYFGTKEEAEKAVEKLKAWKRLKDKRFSFEGYDDGYKHDFNSGHIEFYVENDGGVLNDLDLLFGGEE